MPDEYDQFDGDPPIDPFDDGLGGPTDDEGRELVRVNFGNPIALFPLDIVTLLPQQAMPLHIFEPRYRQMTEHALDSAGLIAMALVDKGAPASEPPVLRSAVCVGRIVQHESLPDGRYNILLQGICRARIIEEQPVDNTRLYRTALLEPVGTSADPDTTLEDAQLADIRTELIGKLEDAPLHRLALSRPVLQQLADLDIPTSAILELVSFAMINDTERRYRLLAEPDVHARARQILGELDQMARLLRLADSRRPPEDPELGSFGPTLN